MKKPKTYEGWKKIKELIESDKNPFENEVTIEDPDFTCCENFWIEFKRMKNGEVCDENEYCIEIHEEECTNDILEHAIRTHLEHMTYTDGEYASTGEHSNMPISMRTAWKHLKLGYPSNDLYWK